jgi:hypothetical protein
MHISNGATATGIDELFYMYMLSKCDMLDTPAWAMAAPSLGHGHPDCNFTSLHQIMS